MRTRLLVPLLAAAIALSGCGTVGVGNYFAPTAAVVNGFKIPEKKISQRSKSALKQPESAARFQGPQGPINRLDLQRGILNELIQEELLVQEARKLGLSVKTSEVEAQIEQYESRFGRKEFLKSIADEGLTLAEVRVFIKDQLLVQKVVAEITKDSRLTDAQLMDFYNENKATYDEQVTAAHVLICANFDQAARNCTHSPEDESLANQISARAKAGEDFAALAKQYTIDPSNKETGGELAPFGRGRMAPEFEQAAFALQPGEISAPVKTAFGFHVIKLIKKGKTFEEAKAEIQQQLGQQQQQQAFTEWIREQMQKAKVRVNPKFGRFDRTTQQVVANQIIRPQQQVPGGIGSQLQSP